MRQDHPYFYLFVRTDLPIEQQIIQTNHATYHMALAYPFHNHQTIPSIVLIGVPHQKALERVIQKLNRHNIAHTPFYEPDWDMGLSAVATTPNLSEEQRSVLRNYSIWREPNYKSTRIEEGVVYD